MKRQGRLILLLWLAWLAPSLCAQTPLPVHVLAEDGPFRDSFIQALDDAACRPEKCLDPGHGSGLSGAAGPHPVARVVG